jgi:hypothetical protein
LPYKGVEVAPIALYYEPDEEEPDEETPTPAPINLKSIRVVHPDVGAYHQFKAAHSGKHGSEAFATAAA